MSVFDFAVVGSGAGGSAAAGALAEGGARVALVEQGGEPAPQADASLAIDRYYTGGGLVASTLGALLPIPTGEALGGTTSINSGTCLRAPAGAAAAWQTRTGGRFGAEAFEAAQEEAWRRLGARRAPEATASPSTRLFLRGLDVLGVAGGSLLDRAETGCRGSGRCCFVCPTGGKMTADRAFLGLARSAPGFELRTRSRLESIHETGSEVRLELREPDGRRELRARRLVLACGALRTPYWVRRHRLGPAWREAGDRLTVHPATKVFAMFGSGVRGWTGVPQGAGLVDPEDPAIRYEGVFTPPELAAVTMPLEGRRLRWWLERYENVASFGFMVRDSGSGKVRYPFGAGLPFVRYRFEPLDVRRMARAMRFLGQVFFAAGATRVLLPINRPGNEFESAETLERADLSGVTAAELQTMGFHPLGTCGLGRVADAGLRLTPRVWAADGSVVPESLGVNPQVTIAALGLLLGSGLLHEG